MSRRDKQAELRRRMAEARSKLSSSKTQAADLDDDGAAGKKRPLPPPEGGGGGILRKSKYTPVTTGAAVGVKPTNEERDSNGDGQHPPLGALMAGYDDSSSDEEEGAPASAVANNQHQQSKSANNGSEEEPVKKKQKNAKFSSQEVVGDRAIADAAAMVQLPVTEVEEEGEQEPSIQKDNVDKPPDKQAQGGNNDKKKASAEISDDVWDEFNSLLEDDEAKTTQDTALANPKDRTSPAEVVPHQTMNNDESPSSQKKKKSKKKKKKHRDDTTKTTTTDMYENEEAMTNVEQASYEARLARLVLLKSKKTQQQHNKNNGTAATDDNNDNLLSTEEFYDPGLAFQQEDNEDAEEDEDAQVDPNKNQTMDKSNLKIDEEVSSEAKPQQASSVNAPARVSLTKILRDRREQARQMSSRGGGGGGSANVDDSKSNDGIEDDSTDDAPDGCWF